MKGLWVEKLTSWHHDSCWWPFLFIKIIINGVFKHSSTNNRSVWITLRTMLKNNPYLVTFHEKIRVSLWTFLPNDGRTLLLKFWYSRRFMSISSLNKQVCCSKSPPWNLVQLKDFVFTSRHKILSENFFKFLWNFYH